MYNLNFCCPEGNTQKHNLLRQIWKVRGAEEYYSMSGQSSKNFNQKESYIIEESGILSKQKQLPADTEFTYNTNMVPFTQRELQ